MLIDTQYLATDKFTMFKVTKLGREEWSGQRREIFLTVELKEVKLFCPKVLDMKDNSIHLRVDINV